LAAAVESDTETQILIGVAVLAIFKVGFLSRLRVSGVAKLPELQKKRTPLPSSSAATDPHC